MRRGGHESRARSRHCPERSPIDLVLLLVEQHCRGRSPSTGCRVSLPRCNRGLWLNARQSLSHHCSEFHDIGSDTVNSAHSRRTPTNAVEPAANRMVIEKAPNRIAAVRGFFFCAPEGIRTPNLLIRSQVLYPLSYGRMFSCADSEESAYRPLRVSVAEARGFEPPDPVKGQVISSDSHSAALARLLGCRPSRTAEERDYTRQRPEGKTAGRRFRFARRSRK